MSEQSILNRHAAVLGAAAEVNSRAKAGKPYPKAKVELAGLGDLVAYLSEWTDWLALRRRKIGEVAAAFDAGVVYTSFAKVKAQIQDSDSYDRGQYFGPFAVGTPAYFDGDPLLLGTNGAEHTRWRSFVARVTPSVQGLGHRLGAAVDLALKPFVEAGQLDAGKDVQDAVTDVLHRIYLGLALSRGELRKARAYANQLYEAALPEAANAFLLNLPIAGNVAWKRAAAKKYRTAPDWHRVQAVADDMGIPANQAAGNLMLALHLASMPATASLVASMIGELVNRPDLAAKLRAEYDAMRDPAAVKGEPLSQAEVDRATLIEKVMNETGRLHPPVQLTNSVTRQATEELVEGARCPFSKGTRVVAAIFQANRDPARYSKPDDWDIERDYSDALMWNGSEGATNHRDCVGRPIASAIVKTFVLTLFGRWKWTGTEPGLAAWPEKQLAAMRPKKLILKGISER